MAEADATAASSPEGGPSLTDVYRRADGIATRVIGGETLLVPFKGTLASLQRIFALNPVAELVWKRLDGKDALEAVLADVLASFDVSRDEAWADLRELVAGLRAAGLVHEVAATPGDAPGA